MGVTRLVDLINTFSAQCCMSVGKSGHERVKYQNIPGDSTLSFYRVIGASMLSW